MKHLDKKTQVKLSWLFIPLAIVVLIEVIYLWFNVNIPKLWFGIDIDILTWCKPALLVSISIIFVGYSITTIRQKCWGEFIIAIAILILMLLNMRNFFVNL